MSKRLQVLMREDDLARIQSIARQQRLSVGEWVRRALSRAASEAPARSADEKLQAIQIAANYSFPTGDIDHMNREIEAGYGNGLP